MVLNWCSPPHITLAVMAWFKWRFSKSMEEISDHQMRLQQMLFVYRVTEHSTTGRTPAELFLGRRINTTLDLLKPSVRGDIDQRQFKTKYYKDRHTSDREFLPNDPIYVRRPVDRNWATAVVSSRTSPLSYTTTSGQRVHADHMKDRFVGPPTSSTATFPDESAEPQSIPEIVLPDLEQATPVLRRSSRPNLGVPPLRYGDEFNLCFLS